MKYLPFTYVSHLFQFFFTFISHFGSPGAKTAAALDQAGPGPWAAVLAPGLPKSAKNVKLFEKYVKCIYFMHFT